MGRSCWNNEERIFRCLQYSQTLKQWKVAIKVANAQLFNAYGIINSWSQGVWWLKQRAVYLLDVYGWQTLVWCLFWVLLVCCYLWYNKQLKQREEVVEPMRCVFLDEYSIAKHWSKGKLLLKRWVAQLFNAYAIINSWSQGMW
jgi:hypothetical protein